MKSGPDKTMPISSPLYTPHVQIESGRWARPNAIPIHDRKCLECNVVEDEYHFVLECNMYTDLRT